MTIDTAPVVAPDRVPGPVPAGQEADPGPGVGAGEPAAVLTDLKGLEPAELDALVVGMGQEPFRARQLQRWIYARGESDLAAMTDLAAGFRRQLGQVAYVSRLPLLATRVSATGTVAKFVFALAGGERIEAVYIADAGRRTACLSSQAGCPLACRFCATGRLGFRRNLTAAEIIDQLLQVGAWAAARGQRLSNVVMMGMGEPLLNYEPVLRAIRLMRLELGPAIGGRKITVSTAGYVPGIRRLAAEPLNVGLAISLHATTDEVRRQLMPIARGFTIAELLAAAREYFDRRGRRVTFEYVLLGGVNDADDDARRLAALTADLPCKLNLIPYNELGQDSPYRRPDPGRIDAFRRLLEAHSIHAVTVRDSQGQDIDAACGQLAGADPSLPHPSGGASGGVRGSV